MSHGPAGEGAHFAARGPMSSALVRNGAIRAGAVHHRPAGRTLSGC